MAQQERIVKGLVGAVNERGLKVDGEWFNFSKFATIDPPQAGDTVELLVKGDKWVQACKVVGEGPDVGENAGWGDNPLGDDDDDGPPFQAPPAPAARAPRPSGPATRAPAPAAPKAPTQATLRAVALTAAAHFHSGRATDEGAEGDVYATAWRFLAWLDQDE